MGLVAIPQFRIEDGPFLALVDFIVEEYQLAIEFDGFVKYGRLDRLAQSTRADIVMAEKIREDHIRELGHRFLRVIWRDIGRASCSATMHRQHHPTSRDAPQCVKSCMWRVLGPELKKLRTRAPRRSRYSLPPVGPRPSLLHASRPEVRRRSA
jgi:hypothetical protein